MGRELKRVPLDFSWPLNVVWKGYLNPYRGHECDLCKGTGYSSEAKHLADTYYSPLAGGGLGWPSELTEDEWAALRKHRRLEGITHRFDGNWKLIEPPLTAEEANRLIAQDPRDLMEGIAQYVLIKVRCKRLGIRTRCSLCRGSGDLWCHSKYKRRCENWKRIEPPKGEGYQLWTTTNEGAPKSPVFETLDALCEWAETHATTFATCRATATEWKQMLDGGVVHPREGNMVFM